MQRTIRSEVGASGVGLFSGAKVSLKILPSSPGSGIVFRRVDLPGKPEIPARLSFVKETPRCTRLANGEASILMVEHLLSALKAMGIDNAVVEVEGPEILAADGSAKPFVDLIEKGGIQEQLLPRAELKIVNPIYFSQGDAHLIALPAEEFRISYTMHYPQSSLLGSQYYTLFLNEERFKKEIAPSRTFSLYEEIFPLIEKGVIRGGGLENALVIKEERVMNPDGTRFPNEMVRHKVLDLIGDLALIGATVQGHIIAVCSGHASNIAFAKKLENYG
jgi:UDP-3-O-[3-hydroxymyristoyl] N-acetylglucosamine deacetylase